MSSFIIDNKTTEKLYEYLESNISNESKVSLLIQALTLSGFEALEKPLSKPSTQLILATNKTPLAQRIACEPGEEKLLNRLNQKDLAKRLLKWLNTNVEIKGIPENRITQNLFHIENAQGQSFIQGSSPFTASGLGLIQSTRLEMNMGGTIPAQTEGLKTWFDSLWNDNTTSQNILADLKSATELLAQDQTPETIYFLTLYKIFNDLLEDIDEESIVKSKTGFKETKVWDKLYKFQKDGVLGIIDKLERHNGCILADSVGLGKTFEALAVIKYYELRNDRVLVLAPKKLRDNWTLYTQNDKRNLLAYSCLKAP